MVLCVTVQSWLNCNKSTECFWLSKIIKQEEIVIGFRNGILKRFLIVLLWIIIALGIYQCSLNLNDTVEEPIPEQEEKQNALSEQEKVEDEVIVPPFDAYIRVLIMSEGFGSIYHTELVISCSEGLCVEADGDKKDYAPDYEFTLKKGQIKKGKFIQISGKNNGRLVIKNLNRNGSSTYRGTLECYGTKDGIVAVNELLVEEYLYGVVPSEMPSGYPAEALKAQAISARSYTYFHKQSYAYPEWRAHMDDSTSFQVYMNCDETEAACQAVDDTKDMVLTFKDALVESFYYSTSSGQNGGAGVWKDVPVESDGYLIESGEDVYAENSEEGEAAYQTYIDHGSPEDVEYNEAWYRWEYAKVLDGKSTKLLLTKLYQMSLSQKKNVRIRSRYLASEKVKEETYIKDIRILNRRKSGLVTKIMIETEHFRISVNTQHAIRQALGCAGDVVIKKDGSSYVLGDILPSAYFYIEKIVDNNGESGNTLKQMIIHGAGLGHGCGMSQNGAKCLAKNGFTAAQILAYYYNGEIKSVGAFMADGL